MKLFCPKCEKILETREINVEKDFALCSVCNETFSISNDLFLHELVAGEINLDKIPKGTWVQEFNDGFEIGATTRSYVAFFLVPFMILWSGGSVGSIYGTQILSGKFSLFESLFGIPFLLGTIVVGGITLMMLFGKITVTVKNDEGEVFTGIGSLGIIKKFIWSEVKNITQSINLNYNNRNNQQRLIILEGKNKIMFGSFLSNENRVFMIKALRKIHLNRS